MLLLLSFYMFIKNGCVVRLFLVDIVTKFNYNCFVLAVNNQNPFKTTISGVNQIFSSTWIPIYLVQ